MNTLCENLNKEPANGTNETASELFSLKLLYENTKHSASYRFIFISPVARRGQKEEGKRRAIARYATAFNKWKRTRRPRQTRDLPLSLFQMKSLRVPLSFLLFFKLMKTFVLRPPLLTSVTDTFSRSLADLASHGASAAPSSIRCIIKYGQRQWQALNRV